MFVVDGLCEEGDYFLFDLIFPHILFLEFLHEDIIVVKLYLCLPETAGEVDDFVLHLPVLVEDAQCLRLEVVQLVVELPNLILSVLAGDCLIHPLNYLPCFLLHRLDLSLYHGKELVLVSL